MVSVLLAILKILGIILLVLLGIILVVIVLVLFVPVRYRITAHRKITEGTPVVAEVKVTWLAHMLSAAFSYPEKAYLHIRAAELTVFRSDKPKPEGGGKSSGKKKKEEKSAAEEIPGKGKPESEEEEKAEKQSVEGLPEKAEEGAGQEKGGGEKDEGKKGGQAEGQNKADKFFGKIMSFLEKIKYTIASICDKIKDIVNNIQYYMEVIKSDAFSGTWALCRGQAVSLLKILLPRKVKGRLLIGTGDPASTGQVLAVFGILYPFVGEHIEIVPDFERQIVEGELFIKGKITAVRILKIALAVFFNKDLRRLIKLFKREAV